MSIVNRYYFKDPKVDEIKKIWRKYAKEYSLKFIFFYITCKWKLHFTKNYTSFTSANTEYKRLYLSNIEPCEMLEMYLFIEIDFLYIRD